jgi:hypothetical protein
MPEVTQEFPKIQKIKLQTWIALFCISVVVIRFFVPSLKYDADSRDLILIAIVCVLVPDVVSLIARVRKLKFGEHEVELSEALDDLASKTEAAEERIDTESISSFIKVEVAPGDIERYLRDPRGGLIAVAADIEARATELLRHTATSPASKGYASPVRAVESLARQGVVSAELPALMRAFWSVRNQAIHSPDSSLSQHDIYRLVDLGVRILDLLSFTRDPAS